MTISQDPEATATLSHLFTFKGKATEIVDFGDTPLGKRIDIHFEGRVEGEKVSGTMRGVDHGLFRPDGVMKIDVRAALFTQDNANISVAIQGYLFGGDTIRDTQVQLLTGDERYSWLNDKVIIGSGESSLEGGLQINYYYYES